MTREVLLASGSRTRKTLLENAGFHVRAVPSGVDEATIKAAHPDDDPASLAARLADAKALAVAAREAGPVIGADQVLALDGALFDKPRDLSEARARIATLVGRTHELATAVCIAEGGRIVWRHLETPRLRMRTLSEHAIDRYIDHAPPDIIESVGAYQYEALGLSLFEDVCGDANAILGLPLLPLIAALRVRGVEAF